MRFPHRALIAAVIVAAFVVVAAWFHAQERPAAAQPRDVVSLTYVDIAGGYGIARYVRIDVISGSMLIYFHRQYDAGYAEFAGRGAAPGWDRVECQISDAGMNEILRLIERESGWQWSSRSSGIADGTQILFRLQDEDCCLRCVYDNAPDAKLEKLTALLNKQVFKAAIEQVASGTAIRTDASLDEVQRAEDRAWARPE